MANFVCMHEPSYTCYKANIFISLYYLFIQLTILNQTIVLIFYTQCFDFNTTGNIDSVN